MIDIQKDATDRLKSWLVKGLFTKSEFSKILNMARPTLDVRLEKSNWSKKEVDLIFENCPF